MEDLFKNVIGKKAEQYLDMLITFVPKFILAIFALIVGLKIINVLIDWGQKLLERTNVSLELRPFLNSTFSFSLKIILFFIVASIIGIETTKFVAVLGAAFFAIGMGLQGSLGHFAAGILILIFRPYKVGDVVEVQGQLGIVKGIQIINTNIELFDKKMAIIPNGIAISDIVTNHSFEGVVRVDTEISMPYAEDFPKVKKLLEEVAQSTPGVLSEPSVFVGIKDFDSHSIRLSVWPFAKVEDYWDVLFAVNANLKKAMSENNIKVAYSEGVELGPIGS